MLRIGVLELKSGGRRPPMPLPAGEKEYQEYFDKVRLKFPSGDLHLVRAGTFEFITGPIRDLPLLFPHAAPQSPKVYRERHADLSHVYGG